MKKYYVLFKKAEEVGFKAFENEAEYRAKESALENSKKLAKEGIPSIVTKNLNRFSLELLKEEVKRFKPIVEEEQKEENYLDSDRAVRAAERYCMSH